RASNNPSERMGSLSVFAPRITVHELATVKNALENPPARADVFATIASVLGAVLTAGKVVLDVSKNTPPKPSTFEAVVFVLAVAVSGILLYRWYETSTKKHPFHDQALSYVKDYIAKEETKPQSTEPKNEG